MTPPAQKVGHVLGPFSGTTLCGLELRWNPYLRIVDIEDFSADERGCARCLRSLAAAERRDA
jgi:hypothetical protein